MLLHRWGKGKTALPLSPSTIRKNILFFNDQTQKYILTKRLEKRKKIKIKYFKPLFQITINQYLLLSVSIRKRILRLISATMRYFTLQVSSVQSKLRTSKQRKKRKIISASNCRLKTSKIWWLVLANSTYIAPETKDWEFCFDIANKGNQTGIK